MAGGMILIGVLLMLMPLPTAMVLHAITQMASNGWRAFLWRAHIRWRPVFVYLIGCGLALGAWSIIRYVPDKPIALLLLGVTPFMARLMPKNLKPNPDSIAQGSFYGFICMGLMLMTGVSGPLMDTFFLGGNFGRREVVATKATCQVASHLTKLIYFGGIVDQAATLDPALAAVAIAASMLGTTLARRILEAMSDAQFRTWANRLITTVAGYYILYGGWLLFTRTSAMAFEFHRLSGGADDRDNGRTGARPRRMDRPRAAALFRRDRDVAHLMPAPDDLGRRGRSRLCRAPAGGGAGRARRDHRKRRQIPARARPRRLRSITFARADADAN
jgi:uncharacterized membrane protein YfcA